jgi:uncharacterized protein YpbB
VPTVAGVRIRVDEPAGDGPRRAAALRAAGEMFRRGLDVEACARELGRAPSTVLEYLAEWIEAERPPSIDAWVAPEVQQQVRAVVQRSENGRLRPMFEALGGAVAYDTIRLVAAHVRSEAVGRSEVE